MTNHRRPCIMIFQESVTTADGKRSLINIIVTGKAGAPPLIGDVSSIKGNETKKERSYSGFSDCSIVSALLMVFVYSPMLFKKGPFLSF